MTDRLEKKMTKLIQKGKSQGLASWLLGISPRNGSRFVRVNKNRQGNNSDLNKVNSNKVVRVNKNNGKTKSIKK